jgi:hypothetical protein
MKSLSQIVLAIVAIVGLVAGITFVSQYRVGGGSVAPPPPPTPLPPEVKQKQSNELHFSETWIKYDKLPDGEVEQESKGYHDFWFENPNSVPVTLGLRSVSCACSGVSLCLLTAEEAERYRRWAPVAAASQVGLYSAGVFGFLSPVHAERDVTEARGVNLNWTPMARSVDMEDGVTVAPNAAGMVRLYWKGKHDFVGSERLTVDLWTRPEGILAPRSYPRIEVAVTFVPALRVYPSTANLEAIDLREERTAEFMCWSATRPDFPLTAKAKHPCFACSCIPMTEADRDKLASVVTSRVSFGYRVLVTVKERVSDTVQMDLGPFSRKVVLTSDPGIPEASVKVTGVVRGEVSVGGSDEDQGKLVLGSFKSSAGRERTIRLTAQQSGLGLALEGTDPDTPSFVKVKSFKEVKPAVAGRTQWDLCVEVPPGSPLGRLPEHAAVLLKIASNPHRHIRIPVAGLIYQ